MDAFKGSKTSLSVLFRKWAAFAYDRPWWVIAGNIIIFILLLSQVPNVVFDMSNEATLHKNDQIRVDYENFKSEFGREDAIILSVGIPNGLNAAALKTLHDLHHEIESTVPHVRDLTSILNVSHTYGNQDELIVEDLLEGYPNHKWEYANLSRYLLDHSLYKNRLISSDGKHLVIAIDLQSFDKHSEALMPLTDQQSAMAVNALRNIIDAHPELDIKMTGEPVLLETINYLTSIDNALTAFLAVFVIISLLIFFFRRRSGLFIPLLVISGSMIGSVGTMGFAGFPYTLISTTTYALIVGMSIADSLHILTIFYKQYYLLGDKRQAIIYAMGHSAPAVTLTSLTTAIGFLSFAAGALASTSQLGISSAAAVFFAFFFTITFIPSVLSIFSISRQETVQTVDAYLHRFLLACAKFSTTFPKTISVLSIVALIVSISIAALMDFSHNPISNFPDDTLAKIENIEIDKVYDGYTTIEVLIDSGIKRGIFEDSFLNQLKQAVNAFSHTEVQGIPLGASKSVLDVIKEVHKALNGNNQSYYLVPESAELVAQELLLYELSNADDLFKLVDSDYQKVRLTLFTHYADGVVYEKLITHLNQSLSLIFDEEIKITITGSNALVAGSVPRALRTMLQSYITASVFIVLVMMLVVRSVRIGLISIIPNILPITLVMAALVLLGIPLDLSTILVGAVAMGIVVDDSLHFLYSFKKYFHETGDAKLAIVKTHTAIGPALFMTTIVFSMCCATAIFSSIFGVSMFGWCLAVITILALLADLIVAPALLLFFLPSIEQTLKT